MPLTVETGTGTNPAANSYLSLADLASYHLLRAKDAWADADDTERTAAAIVAMDWLDRQPWRGLRKLSTQPLAWPRTGIYDELGNTIAAIPQRVKVAQAEAALIALDGELPGDQVIEGANAIQALSAGPVSITYRDVSGAVPQVAAPKLSLILSDLLWGSGTVQLIRT